MPKLVTIAGSLRKGSFNRGLAAAVAEVVEAGVDVVPVEIRTLPHYDADLDVDGGPGEVKALKAAIAGADGVVIATPEYNYGIPGVLKNAIDWASRPGYRSVFRHKPTAIISASGSAFGGARAQGQLKQVLLGMLAEVFPYPEFAVPRAFERFDEAGRLVDEDTRTRLAEMIAEFVAWFS